MRRRNVSPAVDRLETKITLDGSVTPAPAEYAYYAPPPPPVPFIPAPADGPVPVVAPDAPPPVVIQGPPAPSDPNIVVNDPGSLLLSPTPTVTGSTMDGTPVTVPSDVMASLHPVSPDFVGPPDWAASWYSVTTPMDPVMLSHEPDGSVSALPSSIGMLLQNLTGAVADEVVSEFFQGVLPWPLSSMVPNNPVTNP